MSKELLSFLSSLNIPDGEYADKKLDLANTPARVERMWRDELLAGYAAGAEAELVRRFTAFETDDQEGMVTFGPITFHSTCAHHLLPFSGDAFVGYVPGTKLMGASKATRVLNHYSSQLQIQERLARQVVDFIWKHAEPRVAIVMLRATHYCMTCRGVRQPKQSMITTCVRPQLGTSDSDELVRPVLDEFHVHVSRLDR